MKNKMKTHKNENNFAVKKENKLLYIYERERGVGRRWEKIIIKGHEAHGANH